MARISSERLTGVLAGAFLVRAADSLLSVIGQLALPVGEFSLRLTAALPPIFGALLGAAIGCGYLLQYRKRWFYVVTIVALAIGATFAVFAALMPLFYKSSTVDAIRSSMIGRGVAQLCIGLGLITCVVVLLRRKEPNQPPLPTSGLRPAAADL